MGQRVTLSTGNTIEATPNHPFYVRAAYRQAQELHIGDTLFSKNDKVITINSIFAKDTTVEVFNLHVADNDNYFASEAAVLQKVCVFDALISRPNLKAKFDALIPEQRARFLQDFAEAEDALLDVLQGDKGIEAWELMIETSTKKIHKLTLEKVSGLLKDTDFMSKLDGGEATLQDIIKKAANPLDGGTASKLVTLAEHLDNLKVVVKSHHDVPGFDRIITDLKITTFEKQDGISHTLNHMKEIPAGKIDKVDYVFEPEIDGGGLPCTQCRFDVQMKPVNPKPANWVKYYEYKSYLKVSNIDIAQFKNYLSTIDNINELKYVFNAQKLSLQDAKDGMKAYLKNHAAELAKPINQGGIGDLQFEKLFGVNTSQKLINKLDTQTGFDEVLKFVDVK